MDFPINKFRKKYPDLFTLDKVYEQNIEEYLNIELTLIVNKANENAIDYLLKENKILDYERFIRDDYHFYRFFHSIERNFVSKRYNDNENNEDRKYNYLDILDLSRVQTMNIPIFNFIIGLTPTGRIFGNGNYTLKGIFSKLDYACYLALNNGGEIYSLREIREIGSRNPLPKFHEDLQEIKPAQPNIRWLP